MIAGSSGLTSRKKKGSWWEVFQKMGRLDKRLPIQSISTLEHVQHASVMIGYVCRHCGLEEKREVEDALVLKSWLLKAGSKLKLLAFTW